MNSIIPEIRSFNRFYTDVIGLLNRHLLDTPYSLAEARVIYEIYHNPDVQASQIMERMHIDKSYLSRILQKLEKESTISRKRSAKDARSVTISLTAKGLAEFDKLNRSSNAQIEEMIGPLSETQKKNLIAGMGSVENVLNAKRKPVTLDEIMIRTILQPGDLGYVAYLHGNIYAEECGYGLNFEAYVLESLGEFAHQYDPAKDRVWICEHEGRVIGFLAGVHRGESVQLRYFILLAEYRGIGLGKKLMGAFMAYMREQSITKAYLWTTNEQHTATALYARYGFKLTEEKPSMAFDKPLIEQRYDLVTAQ
ncbi:MAG: MarR family transcriptional regulator [Bacteroidetes bacterium]|nr:MarR family transcriptional regulator [Bacteroidota bacterium]